MIVVKVGGRAIKSGLDNVLNDLATLWRNGKELVLIHGGGDYVTEYCLRLGIEPKFIVSPSGIRSRYTSLEELEVYVMVMAGKVNKEIVRKLIKLGIKAVGISGADASLILAKRKKRIIIIDERGRKRVIEGGYTGKITEVNTELLKSLINMKYLPVIAPIAIGYEGELLNVDADQVACNVAKSLRADKLVILTDVEGVIISNEVIREVKLSEIDEIISKVGVGMNRKLLMAKEAIEAGVNEVIISTALRDKPLTSALNGLGTVIKCR